MCSSPAASSSCFATSDIVTLSSLRRDTSSRMPSRRLRSPSLIRTDSVTLCPRFSSPIPHLQRVQPIVSVCTHDNTDEKRRLPLGNHLFLLAAKAFVFNGCHIATSGCY